MMIVVYGASALIFGVLLLRAMFGRPRERWDGAAWMGFLAVLIPNITMLVATFTNGRVVTVDGYFNRVTFLTGPAAQVNEYASPILAAAAVLIALLGVRRSTRINGLALSFAAILLLGAFASALAGGEFMNGARLTALAVFVACAFITRSSRVLTGAATALGVLAVVSLVAAAVVPAIATPECDPRKCGIFGTLFTGVGDNNNAFGLLMALAVPVAWFGMHRFGKTFGALFAVLALASGSRTAQVAATVTLIVLWLASTRVAGRLGRGMTILTTIGAAIAVAFIPLSGLAGDALTGRPGVWATAMLMIDQELWLGHGGDLWRSLVDVGIIPRAAGYSTHNQMLEILFVVGWVGFVAIALLTIALFRANRGRGWQVCALVLPALICGIAERPWSLGAIDWMMWSVVVLVMVDLNDGRLLKDSSTTEHRRRKRQRRNVGVRSYGNARAEVAANAILPASVGDPRPDIARERPR